MTKPAFLAGCDELITFNDQYMAWADEMRAWPPERVFEAVAACTELHGISVLVESALVEPFLEGHFLRGQRMAYGSPSTHGAHSRVSFVLEAAVRAGPPQTVFVDGRHSQFRRLPIADAFLVLGIDGAALHGGTDAFFREKLRLNDSIAPTVLRALRSLRCPPDRGSPSPAPMTLRRLLQIDAEAKGTADASPLASGDSLLVGAAEAKSGRSSSLCAPAAASVAAAPLEDTQSCSEGGDDVCEDAPAVPVPAGLSLEERGAVADRFAATETAFRQLSALSRQALLERQVTIEAPEEEHCLPADYAPSDRRGNIRRDELLRLTAGRVAAASRTGARERHIAALGIIERERRETTISHLYKRLKDFASMTSALSVEAAAEALSIDRDEAATMRTDCLRRSAASSLTRRPHSGGLGHRPSVCASMVTSPARRPQSAIACLQSPVPVGPTRLLSVEWVLRVCVAPTAEWPDSECDTIAAAMAEVLQREAFSLEFVEASVQHRATTRGDADLLTALMADHSVYSRGRARELAGVLQRQERQHAKTLDALRHGNPINDHLIGGSSPFRGAPLSPPAGPDDTDHRRRHLSPLQRPHSAASRARRTLLLRLVHARHYADFHAARPQCDTPGLYADEGVQALAAMMARGFRFEKHFRLNKEFFVFVMLEATMGLSRHVFDHLIDLCNERFGEAKIEDLRRRQVASELFAEAVEVFAHRGRSGGDGGEVGGYGGCHKDSFTLRSLVGSEAPALLHRDHLAELVAAYLDVEALNTTAATQRIEGYGAAATGHPTTTNKRSRLAQRHLFHTTGDSAEEVRVFTLNTATRNRLQPQHSPIGIAHQHSFSSQHTLSTSRSVPNSGMSSRTRTPRQESSGARIPTYVDAAFFARFVTDEWIDRSREEFDQRAIFFRTAIASIPQTFALACSPPSTPRSSTRASSTPDISAVSARSPTDSGLRRHAPVPMPQEVFELTCAGVKERGPRVVVVLHAPVADAEALRVHPAGMVERYFRDAKSDALRAAFPDRFAHSTFPPAQQHQLHVHTVASTRSLGRVAAAIAAAFSKGHWFYVEFGADAINRHELLGDEGTNVGARWPPSDGSNLSMADVDAEETPEERAEHLCGRLLEAFLRQVCGALLRARAASVHPSFRLFVRYAGATLGPNVVPVIAQHVMRLVDLRPQPSGGVANLLLPEGRLGFGTNPGGPRSEVSILSATLAGHVSPQPTAIRGDGSEEGSEVGEVPAEIVAAVLSDALAERADGVLVEDTR